MLQFFYIRYQRVSHQQNCPTILSEMHTTFLFPCPFSNVFIFRYNTVTNVNYAANYAVILDFKTLRM